ncbi:MAG: FAD-binding protein [Candidatus Marinimicrobia bacterium]|nr:FAD-binding protein [Candidatus Neomarinimicrobiota bacterium]
MLKTPIIHALQQIVGKKNVLTDADVLNLYSCDGLRLQSAQPGCVVIPSSTEAVSAIIKCCVTHKIPFVARGSGTGLSGGATSNGGVIIQLSQLNQILEINIPNRLAIIQPGVINAHLSLETLAYGLHFAPDPSSQTASTIGGNVAENSGGPHTLKYGVTTNHVLGFTMVMPDGTIEKFGGKHRYSTDLDLVGFITGSEGTLGIITEITVNLVANPQTTRTFLLTFDTVSHATDCVSAIIEGGVIPSALEMIDNLCIQAVEGKLKAGFPVDAAAILLVELDGETSTTQWEAEQLKNITAQFTPHPIEEAKDEAHRQQLWRGRKLAIGAMGFLAPAFYTNDGVVPRHQLTHILHDIYRIGKDHKLKVANLCHAGDGNIHPIILYDPQISGHKNRAFSCSTDILKCCLTYGGSLTGEHGIGTEKVNLMDTMFTSTQLNLMMKLRDMFDSHSLCNPHKILPTHAGCGEVRNYAH